MVAIVATMRWLRDNKEEWRKVAILTDSQSSVQALRNGELVTKNYLLADFSELLQELHGKEMVIAWITSHLGATGNERADQVANEARGKSGGCQLAVRAGEPGQNQERAS